MYDDILLPTDGSEGTARAVDQALDLAETYGATLHVLYVVDVSALPAEVGSEMLLEELEAAGEEAVQSVSERARTADVNVVASVASGTPHRAILDYAADRDVDLIVMGTHGRSGIDRVLLGSVAEKVVRTAEVPVLTVRMTDDSE